MLIGDSVRDAIKKAVQKAGNPYRFSLRLPGIRHTTIRDWLSGKTQTISDENWKKLYPEIQEFFYQHDGISEKNCIDLAQELVIMEEKLNLYRKNFTMQYKNNHPQASGDAVFVALQRDQKYLEQFQDYSARLFRLRESLRYFAGSLQPKTLRAIFELMNFECYNIRQVPQTMLDEAVQSHDQLLKVGERLSFSKRQNNQEDD